MFLDVEYTLEAFALLAVGGTAVLCFAAVALYRTIRPRSRGGVGPLPLAHAEWLVLGVLAPAALNSLTVAAITVILTWRDLTNPKSPLQVMVVGEVFAGAIVGLLLAILLNSLLVSKQHWSRIICFMNGYALSLAVIYSATHMIFLLVTGISHIQ